MKRILFNNLIIIISCISSSTLISQELKITEFMAANKGVTADNLDDASDWIEIYNASDRSINLKDYYLTDNPTKKNKWNFHELFLSPQDYFIIWASGDHHPAVKLPHQINISYESAGFDDGNFSSILIDGNNTSLNRRGINLAILSTYGEYIESLAFDTYHSYVESDSLAHYLQQLSAGQIIIFSVKDEASHHLTDAAKAIITRIGSKAIYKLAFRDSWGMIAIIGEGVVSECFRKRGNGSASSNISNMHTNFKLDAEGEYIGIFDRAGNLVDAVSFSKQIPNISYGRIPESSDNWAFLSAPTPGATNNNSQFRRNKLSPPIFSLAEGIYSEPVSLTIHSTPPTGKIYYTFDGSQPDSTSVLYNHQPLKIDRTTVIRARCIQEDYFDSDVITRTYLIEPASSIKVVSLVTAPASLWDPDSGIYVIGTDSLNPNYVKKGEMWERPAVFSLFNVAGKNIFNTECGLRIHGGFARNIPKKSLRVYFPDLVNTYPDLFVTNELAQHQVLILSGGTNDSVADFRKGFQEKWSLIRNSIVMQLYKRLGYPVTEHSPASLYLNGEYWGIYIVSERINKQFLFNHLGITNPDLIQDNTYAEAGTLDYWEETIHFFKATDLTIQKNYERALALIDIQNFTDYFIVNLFCANLDWPQYNLYCYRDIDQNSKWKWLMWDADCAFLTEPAFNNLKNVIATAEKNEIFFKLVQTETYREYFCNRVAYILNNILTTKQICATIDSLSSILEKEIENETKRWGDSKTQWKENVDNIKNFVIQRPQYFREIMNAEFGVGSEVFIKILNHNISQGIVKINDNEIKHFPFQGVYFSNLPVKIQVLPDEGYIFKSWGNKQLQDEQTVTITISDSLILNLEFEQIEVFRKTKGNFEIYPNFPNPFHAETTIRLFSLKATTIKIDIYNIKGQSILTLKKNVNAGYNSIRWDAKNSGGDIVPGGLYVFTVSDSKFRKTRKMVVVR